MASTARLVMERALPSNMTRFGGVNGSLAFNGTMMRNNVTSNFIKKLVFAESKSVRTSTIILAAFNVLAAFATAVSILYDCYMASKRCNPKFKASKFCVKQIHPAETFPLILSIGIVVQGITFAVVQSTGLQDLFTSGCSTIAQFMWPALFIVPYIQLVFGIECAVRSLRRMPFQARGPHAVKIYSVIIVLMLVGTWLPSNIYKENDVCFASLMWYLTRYGELGIVLLSISGALMLISAFTIFFRVSRVDLIDEHQRIAASRMVYYLVLGVISLAFVIPYFVSLRTGPSGGDLKAAMMATVVVNLSGLISGLLQLFLRSNTATTSFGPAGSRDRKKHQIRIFGPNDLAFNNQLISPVSGPRTPQELASRTNSRASLIGFEKETGGRARAISMDSLMSPTKRYNNPFAKPVDSKPSEIALGFVPASASTAGRGHVRKPSYSLFPTETENKSPTGRQDIPVSIYDISDLGPPPAIHFGERRHKRDSSIASSATVQIGLRISHAPPTAAPAIAAPPPVRDPNVPCSLPTTTYNPNAISKPPPSPLKITTSELAPPPKSPKRPTPSPLNTAINPTSPRTSPTKIGAIDLSSINKTLPPTPMPTISRLIDATTQLSPSVYSPAKKVSTPKTNSMPRNPLRGNPPGSPSSQPKKSTGGKSDWI